MHALSTTPGRAGTVRVVTMPEPSATEAGVRLRTLEVGICGTDRTIAEGSLGIPPEGEEDLILGHEFLGQVMADGYGFSAGDLVTAIVRRSCGMCRPCAENAPDECDTGDYTERGITRLHGFAREIIVEDPAHLVAVPASVGRFGVLAEPASICVRAIRHAMRVGHRQRWTPRRALVLGAGSIGMLTTYLLRLEDMEVWVASRGASDDPRAELARESGARYVSTSTTPLQELRDDVGGFDLVIEAVGDAEIMLGVLALLRRNGVGCLLGLDPHTGPVSIGGTVVGLDAVLENRVLLGSVNAHASDWQGAVRRLEAIRRRWPAALEAMIGLRVPLDGFAQAFAFRGVKATVVFD